MTCRTSEQWWSETKANPEKLVEWLQKQFQGEITAAERINQYCVSQAPLDWIEVLEKIADQERSHAKWVGQLLKNRGIEPKIDPNHDNRYWNETLNQIESFESGAAVAAHAEGMRLERIRVIARDRSAPADIQYTFQAILNEEIFHEKAFKSMAGQAAMDATLAAHQKGLEALGLINVAEVM